MNDDRYIRSVKDLEKVGCKWWPKDGNLDNDRMQMDTKENLQVACKDKELCKDLIMLLTYGSASIIDINRAILYKCNAFEYLGQKELFIREGIKKNSYRKFWHDDAMDGRWQISRWMLRNAFDLS